jgi:hypothetical protein
MKKIYIKLAALSRSWVLLPLLFLGLGEANAQVLIPYSGNVSLACGTSTTIQDHAGSGNYSNYAYGYVVLNGGFASVMAINGIYDTEAFWDYVTIYDGVGTGGSVIGSYDGYGTVNYTTSPGQTITIEFSSDGSVTYPGLNFTVTSTGACFATPCSGTPAQNTITGPTVGICPGAVANLNLANSYSVGDLSFQWQASTQSSVGLWNNVTGGSTAYQTSPLTAATWYQVIVTCTNSSQSSISGPFQVQVQGTTISNVPYHEDFEGIEGSNKLPNCSWSATNLGSDAYTYVQSNTNGRIPHSGSKFASFYYYPAGTRNFYTNGINLYAGVTYSASVWYQTEYYGYNNWNLALVAGPNQNSTGQFTIASAAPAIGTTYKTLSNTFTVATSGVYYINVKANVSTSSYAYYLSWDDLSIIVPCELNTPVLSVTPNQTVCAGKPITISASGLDTYTWSTGETGNILTDIPVSNQIYTVTGTSTLTGCKAEAIHQVGVFPTPQVGVFTNKSEVCDGESAVLTAFGADNYIWSNNGVGNVTMVTPNATTQYTVYGSNIYGCQGSGVQTIVHHMPAPVSGDADHELVCIGSPVELTGTGAVSYEWSSSSYFNQTNPAIAYPKVTTAYTVTGRDANGCKSTDVVIVTAQDCTGLNEIRTAGGIRVFPNPNAGYFTVVSSVNSKILITDLTGRVVGGGEGSGMVDLNISHLSNGVYYVKVVSDAGIDVIKVVKE